MLLDVNLKLRRGHFELATQLTIDHASVGLLGKSGAGKSTLLNLIAGTILPQSGHIRLNGKILFDSNKGIVVPRVQRPIGAVLQNDPVDAAETVHDNLNGAYFRTVGQRRFFKPAYLIDLLELGSVLDTPIQQLSGSERQRLALARALLTSPKLLLLDDTFAEIGDAYRMQLLPILKRLEEEFGLPVLYASQSVGDIIGLTDRLVVLEHGQTLCSGSLRDIARHHGLFRYLGVRQIDNIVAVTIRQHDFAAGCSLADCAGTILNLPLRAQIAVGKQIEITVRANDIALSRSYIDGISIQNQLKGRICALISTGESMIVQIDCGGTLLAEITPGACVNMGLREGDVVYCLIKTHAIVYLAELDALPYQRIISHGDGFFYLSPAAIEPQLELPH